jgi:Rrf2 family protein
VPLSDLARHNNIPPSSLEQAFRALRNAGVVRAQVGSGGGYSLARPAATITVGSVIRILDGTVAPVSCVSRIAYGRCGCADEETCLVRLVMEDVRNAIVSVIDSTTLADLVARGRKLQSKP